MTGFDKTEFAKEIKKMAYSKGLWDVWSDFLLMSATALSNAVDKRKTFLYKGTRKGIHQGRSD